MGTKVWQKFVASPMGTTIAAKNGQTWMVSNYLFIFGGVVFGSSVTHGEMYRCDLNQLPDLMCEIVGTPRPIDYGKIMLP